MRNKKGFTLVELSIVLVIIGLLIGGILVAQSMINTVRIQGVVRQLQKFDITVSNFQTKYNQLPGDSSLFSAQGNNNGQIANGGGYNETENAWAHLSLGVGFYNSLGNPYQLIAANDKNYCPQFDIQDPSLSHCWVMRWTGSVNNYEDKQFDSILARDAAALDQKIDDGARSTGKVYFTGSPGPDDCTGVGTGYNMTTSTFGCTMHFQISAASGNAN